MSDNKISNVKPDFEELTNALVSQLSQSPSWTDLLSYSAGRSLIEFMAAVGTMLNYSVEKSVQETYLDTATLDRSIYRAARLLGVSPARNSSSKVTCTIQIAGSSNIPAYSQFSVDGDDYYNIDPIIHPSPGSGSATISSLVLYQGTIASKKFVANGNAYQSFVFGANFTAAENFLDVKVAGSLYQRQKEPLWNTSVLKVFQDRTKPDGSVEVIFGNGIFGEIPALNAQVVVTYAECKGSASNKALSALDVKMTSTVQGLTTVEGITDSGALGAPSNGTDYDTAESLKFTAPRLFAANKRAVRRDDWRSLALSYPGKKLADALVWGEHEQRFINTNSFGPINLNVVRVAVLPETGNLSTPELTAFTAYLEQYKIVNSKLIVTAPAAVLIRLSVKVYITGETTVVTVNDYVLAQLRALFGRTRGSLGKTYHVSDITRLIFSEPAVDYCEVTSLEYSSDNGIVWLPATLSVALQPLQYAVLQEPITLLIQTTQRGD